MEWYLKVLREYANFSGRARRKEFWMFTLMNSIIGMVFIYGLGLALIPLSDEEPIAPLIPSFLYLLIIFLPSLAVQVRRLHDVGKSGWYLLLAFIPLIGTIWLFVLFVTEGDRGPNAYGEDPKEWEVGGEGF
jgi:uncharacterized membrane protein YhaH (DUF805 family)